MAISKMTKIIIASHRSQAAQLLEQLQQAGIVQILDAERAMVSKEWPELQVEIKRPKDIEDLLSRLEKTIALLRNYTKQKTSIFSPLAVVNKSNYSEVVTGSEALDLLNHAQQAGSDIDRLNSESAIQQDRLKMLLPFKQLDVPVEQISRLENTCCLTGLIGHQYFDQLCEQLDELATVEQVGLTGNTYACVIVCMNDSLSQIQKILRAGEFEHVSFESMTGTIAELIDTCRTELEQIQHQLSQAKDKAAAIAQDTLKLQILFDHSQNLLTRQQTQNSAAATESVVLLEGWVRTRDYKKLEKIVAEFSASTISEIIPGDGEEIPVEIENNKAVRPFEIITRLYGMPQHFEVDPTVFLAPFFALFFGLCLTDAGYGLIMIALIAYFIKKMQGNKLMMWMLIICSITTVAAGALTGGWFGDAVQVFLPGTSEQTGITALREKIMLFDPLEKPMIFFYLSLILGYFQLIFGLIIAFVHNLRRKDYIAAACDQFTWLVMLNSIVIFGFSKAGAIDAQLGSFFGKLAIVPAIAIVLFSQRQGGWGGRIGMGCFELFSTIFWMGDVLSYLRLMALGMVTAGLGLAINVITQIVADLPYGIGFVLAPMVFVGGHAFNLGMSGLSAFVHTLRLQYVEFFPKFLTGGGKLFEPLAESFKHIYVKK